MIVFDGLLKLVLQCCCIHYCCSELQTVKHCFFIWLTANKIMVTYITRVLKFK